MKKNAKSKSNTDTFYKQTKCRSRKRSSMNIKVLAWSNKNFAHLGGEFSSGNKYGLEDIEKEKVFERLVDRTCNNDSQKDLHCTPKNDEKTGEQMMS